MTEANLPEPKFKVERLLPYGLTVLELLLALIAGFAFTALGAGGGAWILGGIGAGVLVFYLYRSFYNSEATPDRQARKVGQLLIGLTVGFSLQQSSLLSLSSQLPIFILLALSLVCSGITIGSLYSHLAKTDLLTATLATVPGNVGIMASIAADYGGNISLVSLVQLIRFTAVILIIPVIARVSNPHDVGDTWHTLTRDLFTFDPRYTTILLVVLGVATLTARLGAQAKVPVANFLGAIATGIAFNALLPDSEFNLPPTFRVVGQILLGTTIGEYWSASAKPSKVTVAVALVPVALTFLAGFICAEVALFVTPWDWLTCLLVTAPGGSPEMIWISLVLHHNVEIVTAGHLIRLMVINLTLPALVALTRSPTECPPGSIPELTEDSTTPFSKSP